MAAEKERRPTCAEVNTPAAPAADDYKPPDVSAGQRGKCWNSSCWDSDWNANGLTGFYVTRNLEVSLRNSHNSGAAIDIINLEFTISSVRRLSG